MIWCVKSWECHFKMLYNVLTSWNIAHLSFAEKQKNGTVQNQNFNIRVAIHFFYQCNWLFLLAQCILLPWSFVSMTTLAFVCQVWVYPIWCSPGCPVVLYRHSNSSMPSVISASPADAQTYFSLNKISDQVVGDRIVRRAELRQTRSWTRSQSQQIELYLQVRNELHHRKMCLCDQARFKPACLATEAS